MLSGLSLMAFTLEKMRKKPTRRNKNPRLKSWDEDGRCFLQGFLFHYIFATFRGSGPVGNAFCSTHGIVAGNRGTDQGDSPVFNRNTNCLESNKEQSSYVTSIESYGCNRSAHTISGTAYACAACLTVAVINLGLRLITVSKQFWQAEKFVDILRSTFPPEQNNKRHIKGDHVKWSRTLQKGIENTDKFTYK